MVLAAKTADCPAGAVECIAESVYPADIANCCREPSYRRPLPPDERAALAEQLIEAVRDRLTLEKYTTLWVESNKRILHIMEQIDGRCYGDSI